MSDCLLRWYAELLSANESLKEICRGVTGDGRRGVRPDWERIEGSVVVIEGRLSLPVVRDADGAWLSPDERLRECSR